RGKAARESPVSDCGTVPYHKHRSQMRRKDIREKHAARDVSTVDTRLPTRKRVKIADVDADHESHIRKRRRYDDAGDMCGNKASHFVNYVPNQTVGGVEPNIYAKDPISQTRTQNAYSWEGHLGSSLPASLVLSLFKHSPQNSMYLRPITDMTGALRIPVQLPPLKDVFYDVWN